MSHPDRAEPSRVQLSDLVSFVPSLRAGAQALRTREQRARQAHALTDAQLAAEDAETLEALADHLDDGSLGEELEG